MSEDESPPAESGKRGLRFVDSAEDDVDKEKGEEEKEEMTGDELSTESQQVPVFEPAVEQEYVMKGRFPFDPWSVSKQSIDIKTLCFYFSQFLTFLTFFLFFGTFLL